MCWCVSKNERHSFAHRFFHCPTSAYRRMHLFLLSPVRLLLALVERTIRWLLLRMLAVMLGGSMSARRTTGVALSSHMSPAHALENRPSVFESVFGGRKASYLRGRRTLATDWANESAAAGKCHAARGEEQRSEHPHQPFSVAARTQRKRPSGPTHTHNTLTINS